MLLRSSSTPLLGSLVPPDPVGKHSPSSFAFTFNTVSSPATATASFRRTNSEGNLNTLSHAPDPIEDSFSSFDSFNHPYRRPARSVLQSIPSFSFYGSKDAVEEEENEDEDEECIYMENRMEAAIMSPEVRTMEQAWTRVASREEGDNEMYLAKGIGIGGAGGAGGGWSGGRGGGGGEGDKQQGMEDYYKKMIEENPGNALVLSNYAHFLYQVSSNSKPSISSLYAVTHLRHLMAVER